ncbi:MAG: hypothetical protein WA091_02425 [Minisyncoccales bacterium]
MHFKTEIAAEPEAIAITQSTFKKEYTGGKKMILKYHDGEEFVVFMFTNAFLIATIFGPSIVMGLSVASVLISLASTLILSYFLIIFLLAKYNVHFTFIEEGTAKRIYRGGRFIFAIMVYFQHSLTAKSFKVIDDNEEYDGKEEIIEETRIEKFFTRWLGVHYIGPWPLYRIPYRKFTWTSTDGETGEDKTRTESQDYILIRPDLYSSTLKKAEDKNNVPISWNFSGVLGIVDIGAATKVQNPYQVVMATIWNFLKDVTGSNSFEDLIRGTGYTLDQLSDKKIGEEARQAVSQRMMKEWSAEGGMIEEMIKFCGVKLFKFNIKNMDPDDNYRKLTTKKIVAEKNLIVTQTNSRGEAYALAQMIAGAAMQMLSFSWGLSVEALTDIKRKNPEEFKKVYEEEYKQNIATIIKTRVIDTGSLSEFNTNADGNLGGIIASIAAGNMIASRSSSAGKNSPRQKVSNTEKQRKNKLFKDAGFDAFVHDDDDDDESS